MADVYVLGSGFSKAISEIMPTLGDLTTQVLNRLRHTPLRDEWNNGLSENIELLLTHLSSSHPWWGPAQLHQHRALFYEATGHIAELIGGLETSARIGTRETDQHLPPSWLRELVSYWREHISTVVTFNYDTLVECAAEAAVKHPHQVYGYTNLYVSTITPASHRSGIPIVDGGYVAEDPPTFTLLKLHGSLSWFYSGIEGPPGDVVYATPIPLRWPWKLDAGYRRYVEDKVPLIVPPLLEKGPHLTNAVLRGQWRRAREALATAQRIVFMGYSLPETDLGVRFLLSTLPTSPAIFVVDRNPDVVEHYRELLPDHRSRISAPTGGSADAIPDFVNALVSNEVHHE